MSLFISVMKFRPLIWRNTHPFILADRYVDAGTAGQRSAGARPGVAHALLPPHFSSRMEDITDPEEKRQNPKCDRIISVYGYVRGTHFKPSAS